MFRNSFKDIVGSRFATSFFVGFMIVIMYYFVISPGLSMDNTVINIGSIVFGVMLLMFVFFFIKHQYFSQDEFELFMPDPHKEPETELDYNPDKIKSQSKKTKTKRKQPNRRLVKKTTK